MNRPPEQVTPPAELPLEVVDVKLHCRVDHSDDDTLLAALLQAATDHLDGWSGVLGRCLVSQVWQVSLDAWPAVGEMRLPFPDVSAATVVYSDISDDEQSVSSSLVTLDERIDGTWLRFRRGFNYPALYSDRTDPVRISITAGYGAASAVPEALKAAIKLLVGHWYQHREAVVTGTIATSMPRAVDSLISPYRRRQV